MRGREIIVQPEGESVFSLQVENGAWPIRGCGPRGLLGSFELVFGGGAIGQSELRYRLEN